MIVADANLLLYLLVDGPQTATAAIVLQRDPDWLYPTLCRSEVRNAIARLVRAGRIGQSHALRVLREAAQLLDGREVSLPDEPVLHAALQSGCTAYDCEYVVLARAAGAPLITFDARIRAAFPDVCHDPAEFAGA